MVIGIKAAPAQRTPPVIGARTVLPAAVATYSPIWPIILKVITALSETNRAFRLAGLENPEAQRALGISERNIDSAMRLLEKIGRY